MKYGELIIETLKIMDLDADNLNLENIETFMDNDDYADIVRKIKGATNRALDRLASRKKLPYKTATLLDFGTLANYITFDLSTISDFRNVHIIAYIEEFGGYIPNIDYIIEANTLMIDKSFKDGLIRLIYNPTAPAITDETQITDEIGVPDELARLLPYYIKSDILVTEEPQVASLARNKFEMALDEITLNEETTIQQRIEKVYSI